MIASCETRLLLTQMEAAHEATRRLLLVVERQIRGRAERMTITEQAKRRQHGRGKSTWTPADERLFQQHVAALCLVRRNEIDGLTRKLDRQDRAIAAFRERHGLPPSRA